MNKVVITFIFQMYLIFQNSIKPLFLALNYKFHASNMGQLFIVKILQFPK